MQDTNKLDCRQVGEMLGAFRDMELELAEVEIVEAHLEGCPTCRLELAAIEMVVSKLQSLPQLPIKDFADAIEARINQGVQDKDKQPALAAVSANLIAMPSAGKNMRQQTGKDIRMLLAVAALLLLGFVAAVTLVPRTASEVALAPRLLNSQAGNKLESEKSLAPLSEDLVALYDEESSNNVSDSGITTNEDGLYAIKM